MTTAIDLWNRTRHVKPVRSSFVRCYARAPRTPFEAVTRIRCLDTAYRTRRRLDKLVQDHLDVECMLTAGLLSMAGLCAVASHGLVQALAAEDITAEIVEGDYVVSAGYSRDGAHCWVTVPGVFAALDITASQFMSPMKPRPLVVARQRPGLPYVPVRCGKAFYRVIDRLVFRGRVPDANRPLLPNAWDHLRWWEGSA